MDRQIKSFLCYYVCYLTPQLGPQLFYSIFHTLDESSSYWRTICGLELCFVVCVYNNQCFDFIYDNYRVRSWRSDAINYYITYCQIADLKLLNEN